MKTTTLPLGTILDPFKDKIKKRLIERIPEPEGPVKPLYEAARYFLSSPGKLLRSSLVLVAAQSLGQNIEACIDPCCSLELLHSYSLIHDDLPCMDDDDFRRGRATLHKVFDEATAILVGDFLLTESFDVLVSAKHITDTQKVQLIQILAKRSGGKGMIAGQMMDLLHEGKPLDQDMLVLMHEQKTAALITAALEFAGTICAASQETLDLLIEIGQRLGLAYQVVDDILDVTKSSETLGKPAQSDLKKNKATSVRCLGLEQATSWVDELFLEIKQLIKKLPCQEDLLESFISRMLRRNY